MGWIAARRDLGRLTAALLAVALAIPAPAPAADPFEYRLQVTPEDGEADPAVQARQTARFAQCQTHAEITSAIAACFQAEFVRQDALLNQAWTQAVRRIGVARREPLLRAQRAWIAARDPFCRREASRFAGGTIAPVVVVSCRVELTIRRTIWLEQLR